jgi:hypothetical protein
VYALNAANGDKLWEYQTDAGIRYSLTISKDLLLVGTDRGTLYALSLLQSATPPTPSPSVPEISSQAIALSLIVIAVLTTILVRGKKRCELEK